jgi:hypothetical protein
MKLEPEWVCVRGEPLLPPPHERNAENMAAFVLQVPIIEEDGSVLILTFHIDHRGILSTKEPVYP